MNQEVTVKQHSPVITSYPLALGIGQKLGRIKEEVQMIHHRAKS